MNWLTVLSASTSVTIVKDGAHPRTHFETRPSDLNLPDLVLLNLKNPKIWAGNHHDNCQKPYISGKLVRRELLFFIYTCKHLSMKTNSFTRGTLTALTVIALTTVIMLMSNCGGNSRVKPLSAADSLKGLKDFYKDYFPIGVAVSPRSLQGEQG